MNSILLREAYSLLASIPSTSVRLDTYHHVDGQGNVSGCLLGHLAIAHFAGLSLDADGCLVVPDAEAREAWYRVAEIFGLTLDELCGLVGVRETGEAPSLSDKELLMERFEVLFAAHGLELYSRGYYLFLENA